jgi:hypothetical protein
MGHDQFNQLVQETAEYAERVGEATHGASCQIDDAALKIAYHAIPDNLADDLISGRMSLTEGQALALGRVVGERFFMGFFAKMIERRETCVNLLA